ncbi:MAG: isopentenyl phosphate kinase [Halobacteriaceae archaeon]
MIVLKLGGSVVTRKDVPETVDEAALERAAAALAGRTDLVVVHGGGSFGHHHADAHGVSQTRGTRDPAAVRAVHDAMATLNGAVVDALAAADVPAVPVHPLSAASRDGGGRLSVPLEAVRRLHGEGFVPVVQADVVAHEGAGATVVSGDELVVELAAGMDADRVGLCSTVEGVYDESGAVIAEITSFAEVADALGESAETDVTGGMAAKVRALLDLDVPASVFGPDALEAFLAGDRVGTTVRGE